MYSVLVCESFPIQLSQAVAMYCTTAFNIIHSISIVIMLGKHVVTFFFTNQLDTIPRANDRNRCFVIYRFQPYAYTVHSYLYSLLVLHLE